MTRKALVASVKVLTVEGARGEVCTRSTTFRSVAFGAMGDGSPKEDRLRYPTSHMKGYATETAPRMNGWIKQRNRYGLLPDAASKRST